MSVEDADVIDAIGVEVGSGKVILTIADHLDWSNADDHERKLQDKLNTYIAFVESGELIESYPDAKGRVPVIDVVLRVSSSVEARDFLAEVAGIIEDAGIEFRMKTLADDELA